MNHELLKQYQAMPKQKMDESRWNTMLEATKRIEREHQRKKERTARLTLMTKRVAVLGIVLVLPILFVFSPYKDEVHSWLISFNREAPAGENQLPNLGDRVSELNWEVTPQFEHSFPLPTGARMIYQFRGDSHFNGAVEVKYAVKGTHYFAQQLERVSWYIFTPLKDFEGKEFSMKAISQASGKEYYLPLEEMPYKPYYDPNEVTLQYAPFTFEETGLWRLELYVDGLLYGQVVVPVKEPYIHIGKYFFPLSREDVHVGEMKDLWIHYQKDMVESTRENIERRAPIQVLATYVDDPTHTLTFDFLWEKDSLGYKGHLQLDRVGAWELQIGEYSTVVEAKQK